MNANAINVLDYIDDDWIKPYHLPQGREVTLVVTDARVENLPKRERLAAAQRVSLGLRGAKRRLLLNKTNVRTLLNMGWGANASAWAGRSIVLTAGKFPRDPSKEVRVVVVAKGGETGRDDSHTLNEDAPPPVASADTIHTDAGREPGMEG